jgi:hypothetical protein
MKVCISLNVHSLTISIDDGRDKSVAISSGKRNMCDVKEGNGMKRDGADKFLKKKEGRVFTKLLKTNS